MSNPKISKYVHKHFAGDFRKLESEYINKLLDIVSALGEDYIVWQEVFDNKDKITNRTVVEVWKGGDDNWEKDMRAVTSAGLRGILAAPWYLNYITYGADWVKYYTQDPQQFGGSGDMQKLVIGGEVGMGLNIFVRLRGRLFLILRSIARPACGVSS